jgi:hypothetical protein
MAEESCIGVIPSKSVFLPLNSRWLSHQHAQRPDQISVRLEKVRIGHTSKGAVAFTIQQ